MTFIELTNAGELRLKRMTFRTDSITSVLEPMKEDCGCIVEVNSVKYRVKETYSEVCNALNTKNK